MKNKYIDTGRKQQKLKTRSRILAGAQKLLGRGAHFALEDVATESGVSRATIYRYYSSVEVLAAEAVLDLNTKDPEAIYEDLKDLPMQEMILGLQDYYNRFALANEPAFRKYLSVAIATDSPGIKRGARRNRAMDIILKAHQSGLKKKDVKKLICIASLLMGMEALIVTKDVCRLDDQESLDVLKWGMEMILKGLFTEPLP